MTRTGHGSIITENGVRVDINEIIGRAMWEQRRRSAAEQYPELGPLEEWGDGSIPAANGVLGEAAAVVEALGEAGYVIVDPNDIHQRITDAIRDADERSF